MDKPFAISDHALILSHYHFGQIRVESKKYFHILLLPEICILCKYLLFSVRIKYMIPTTNIISRDLSIIPAKSISSGWAFGESGGGKVTE